MNSLTLVFAMVSTNLNLPPQLLSSVCYVESKHTVNAIHVNDGGSDSLGICQIKLLTAKQFGFKGTAVELRNNYNKNIFYAGKYLKYQLNRYNNDPLKAVAAYNAGTYKKNRSATRYVKQVVLAWEGNNGKD